jgi:hypothetical protein
MNITSMVVEAALRKYDLPLWAKPYIFRYVKGMSRDELKRDVGFLRFGRRKGSITGKGVTLPNGVLFKMDDIVHLLNLFYYGESRISAISGQWATTSGDKQHSEHFRVMQKLELKRARAIKNFVQGLGHKVSGPSKELVEVFDYVEALKNWEDRVITKKILLYMSYVNPIGYVFYRVFYPVSSEFLRPLANIFTKKELFEEDGTREAEALVRNHTLDSAALEQLSEQVMSRVASSIKAEMPRAKKAGIEREAQLLMELAVAHPIYRLVELGADMKPEKTIKRIMNDLR